MTGKEEISQSFTTYRSSKFGSKRSTQGKISQEPVRVVEGI